MNCKGTESEKQSTPPSADMNFPRGNHLYTLGLPIITTDVATMYRAKHVNPTTGEEVPVGIKIVNISKIEDIYLLTNQVHVAKTCDHENMIKVHCSFAIKDQLWIVMPPLSRFSIRSVIQSNFPNGLPNQAVAFILSETLKGLNYLHGKNKMHKYIGADCIFLDEESRVKLVFPDLTMSEDSDDQPYKSTDVVPHWIIDPELMSGYGNECSKATDIWMFGLLALELLHGRIPASVLQELKVLDSGTNNTMKKKKNHVASKLIRKLGFWSCLSSGKQKKLIPEAALGEVISACLLRDSKKRPTADRLMNFELFRQPVAGDESLKTLLEAWK